MAVKTTAVAVPEHRKVVAIAVAEAAARNMPPAFAVAWESTILVDEESPATLLAGAYSPAVGTSGPGWDIRMLAHILRLLTSAFAVPFAASPSSAAAGPPSCVCRFPLALPSCDLSWPSLSLSHAGQCTQSILLNEFLVTSSYCVLGQ